LPGKEVVEAVREEFDKAVRLNKPVFAYIKDTDRTTETEHFRELVKKSKYADFKNSS
jgi:hypothetical protein